MPIVLEKNMVKVVFINSITENAKSFPKGNRIMYRHDIFCQDKEGNTERFEYLTYEPTQRDFVPGTYQSIKCLYPDQRGTQIEVYDETPKSPVIPVSSPLPKSATTPTGDNCYSVNVAGASITFAMAWAKDLKVAEISARGPDASLLPDDLKEIVEYADYLNNALCQRVNFR